MQSLEPPHSDTISPRPYVCDVCKKSYTRSEHLARHYRGHTRDRPFACETCGKDFARRDILNRHASIHNVNERPRETARNLSKRRTRNACINCVKAKLRCSDSRPCERCATRSIPCNDLASAAKTKSQGAAPADLRESHPPVDESSNVRTLDHHQQQQHNGTHDIHIHDATTPDRSRASTHSSTGSGMSQPMQLSLVPMPSSNTCDLDVMMYNEATNPILGIDNGFDDMLMGNFLHDIVDADGSYNAVSSSYTAGLPDVLHYGFDEFADFYSSSIPNAPPSSAPVHTQGAAQGKDFSITSRYENEISSVLRAVDAGEQAFKESMWLWDPSKENDIVSEQIHLILPGGHSFAEHQSQKIDPGLRLSTASRDRLLHMVLRTCDPRVQRQVISRFPSTGTLSAILAEFKTRHSSQIAPWIHFPTLNLDNECEEFMVALICTGAADSRRPEIRKLGFALQEAARLAILKRLEEDNMYLRELRSAQALLLVINVGLNSASRRKIEIAESLTLLLVTMLRRGGRFRHNRDNSLAHADGSKGQDLYKYWKRWVEEESFTRLAYHVLFQDVQTSLALFRQPIISYPEIHLTMPCSEGMWQAESGETWHQKFRTKPVQPTLQPLTLPDYLHDLGLLSLHQAQIDVQMSLRVMVFIFWLRVWQFVQMRASFRPGTGYPNLITVNHTRQHLLTTGQDLVARFSEGSQVMHPCVRMVLELSLMHLHVSLEDIQHLAGKEGEILAREAASRLRSWISLPESRHALFYAGQIAKSTAQCPPQYLRGFHAVVIYHASLTMWAYALLAPAQASLQTTAISSSQGFEETFCMVAIDGEETPELRCFILLGHGTACIRNCSEGNSKRTTIDNGKVPLTDAAWVMRSMAGLLSGKDKSENYCIPIIPYLTRLMCSLAKASTAMKLLRQEIG